MTQAKLAASGLAPGTKVDLQYLAVRDYLANLIQARNIAAEGKLPSERQVEAAVGAARGTVRFALFQLEAEGLIYRRDRSGWYVSPPAVIYDPTRWDGFMSYVAAQGRTPATETLDIRLLPATEHLAAIFGVHLGDDLQFIRRLRRIDGRPVLVEQICVDPKLAPDLLEHCLDGSLTSILKRVYGISVARNKVQMRPCALVKAEAQELSAKSGTPGLSVIRTSYDALDRVVEYDEEYWRHDAIQVNVDISIS
jgi:DNA-binding GntR family transcriptional regulator